MSLAFEERLADLVTFGTLLTATQDHDPIYPLMREVIRACGLDAEQAAWLVYVYLTFYNTASAWLVFSHFPENERLLQTRARRHLQEWEQAHRSDLPLNIERRGLRGGKWVGVWADTFPIVGPSLWSWLQMELDGAPRENYERLWDRLQTLPHVGRWAAFKWLDLLQHVLGAPVEAPDMRLAYCSGPRQALEELYLGPPTGRQDPDYIAYLNQLGEHLRDHLAHQGLSVTWDVLETILCNYNSLSHGRYYCGHDWDEHLHDTLVGLGDSAPWLAARQTVAPHKCLLGETGGWAGVRRPLKRLYRDSRVIMHETLREFPCPSVGWST